MEIKFSKNVRWLFKNFYKCPKCGKTPCLKIGDFEETGIRHIPNYSYPYNDGPQFYEYPFIDKHENRYFIKCCDFFKNFTIKNSVKSAWKDYVVKYKKGRKSMKF